MYFVTYDADGQHNVKDVKRMLNEIETGDFDIILGSRFLGKAENIKPFKKFFLKVYEICVKRLPFSLFISRLSPHVSRLYQ